MSDARVDQARAALLAYLRRADGDPDEYAEYLERRAELAVDLLWELVDRCPIEMQASIRARSTERPR